MRTEDFDWFDALNRWDDWWLTVTEYAWNEGDEHLADSFYDLNRFVSDTLCERLGVDKTPFHEIGGLVKRHQGIRGRRVSREVDPHVSMSDIHNAINRYLPAKEDFLEKLFKQVDGKSGDADHATIPTGHTTIPTTNRSKPISLTQAARLLGQCNRHSGPKWLKQCIDDGTIVAEQFSKQRWVFDKSQFPEKVQHQLDP